MRRIFLFGFFAAQVVFAVQPEARPGFNANGNCYAAGRDYELTAIGQQRATTSKSGWGVLERTKAACESRSKLAELQFHRHYPSASYKKKLIAENKCPAYCIGLPTSEPTPTHLLKD